MRRLRSAPRRSPAAPSLLAVSVRKNETHRGVQLRLLNRLGRVDALGTDNRAFAHEAALPDALGVRDHRQPLLDALVARIQVVASRERGRGRAEELIVQAVHRAGRVAEHAVDAFAELAELVDLLHGLAVLTCAERVILLADDPWLDRLQLVHEAFHVDDEIADDWEVLQWLDGDRP